MKLLVQLIHVLEFVLRSHVQIPIEQNANVPDPSACSSSFTAALRLCRSTEQSQSNCLGFYLAVSQVRENTSLERTGVAGGSFRLSYYKASRLRIRIENNLASVSKKKNGSLRLSGQMDCPLQAQHIQSP